MDFKNRKQHRKEGNHGWRTNREEDAPRQEEAKNGEEEEIHQLDTTSTNSDERDSSLSSVTSS